MIHIDYRVAPRTDREHAGSWGLWSDRRQCWLGIVYPSERQAIAMLAYLRRTFDARK
ncbi:hypothetical protein [Sphingomonas morindae]|uniref:Uncharacterized protein n=1 Tax=Sphingomonas morindae TaxID=1541170 RepID=A0ABY4XEA0_9SPHN|nr:hypothetical protein [Sphingomonas morindae]USI75240.1 hypothetical protein LHA26_19880 [Sphingomonas morindae]